MSDARILHEGYAPTPFTAAEIREHCPDGLRVTIAVHGEDATTFHTSTFLDGDTEGVTIEAAPCDRDGTPTGPASGVRSTWLELQGHASFPEATTLLGEETISGPLGILPCRRYDLRGEGGTTILWFAIDHPGMPVRIEKPGSLVEVIDLTVLGGQDPAAE